MAEPGCRAASASSPVPASPGADALATAVAVEGGAALKVVEGLAGYESYLIRPDGSEA